jgi:hypothetical protein
VHGIGDASTGKDRALPLELVRQMLGDEAPSVAIHRMDYDVIDDWLATKSQFQTGITALKRVLALSPGAETIDATIAEYVGDVRWPIPSAELRFAVRDALMAPPTRRRMGGRLGPCATR